MVLPANRKRSGGNVKKLETHEIDREYGTDLKLVNGIPISFTRVPDAKPSAPRPVRDKDYD
jgi:hypothetical protein